MTPTQFANASGCGGTWTFGAATRKQHVVRTTVDDGASEVPSELVEELLVILNTCPCKLNSGSESTCGLLYLDD